MQDVASERAFYAKLFSANPENEHITGGYEEIHARALPEPPHGVVLDLGCGTGAHAVRLARRGCDVIAADLTREGVRSARARFAREGLAGKFVVADAERLPFRDASCAVTWTFLLLHHFPKLDRLPLELARVTRERMIAFEPNAQNGLTWLANNLVNRWWGISAMTPNQRALWPHRLRRVFRAVGFEQHDLRYVERAWNDGLGWARRLYGALTAWLPARFRANKFLVVYGKGRP
jgi:SAM-dependent methyltransferase